MKKYFYLASAISLFLIVGLTFGCAQKSEQPDPSQQKQTQEEKDKQEQQKDEEKTMESKKEKSTPSPTPMEKYQQKYSKLPTKHKVEKGECLWWIAEDEQIYNDPFMWPLIYKANKNKIDDPDLIYPQQNFSIPREFRLKELKQSRKSAGAPSPYKPPKEANISAKLRDKLGWSF